MNHQRNAHHAPIEGGLFRRFLFMIFFGIAWSITEALLFLLTLVQFIVVAVRGHANDQLLDIGRSLSLYAYQLVRYFTFNTEYEPFPFNRWPSDSDDDSPWSESRRDEVRASQVLDDLEAEDAARVAELEAEIEALKRGGKGARSAPPSERDAGPDADAQEPPPAPNPGPAGSPA
ncbi:MAG: DUF4389 domain-containing protein [Pseudomonadota bacterium]